MKATWSAETIAPIPIAPAERKRAGQKSQDTDHRNRVDAHGRFRPDDAPGASGQECQTVSASRIAMKVSIFPNRQKYGRLEPW